MMGFFAVPLWDAAIRRMRCAVSPPEPRIVIHPIQSDNQAIIRELVGPFGKPMPSTTEQHDNHDRTEDNR